MIKPFSQFHFLHEKVSKNCISIYTEEDSKSFNVPQAVQDEEQLNEDAAKWKDASHEGGGDGMRQPALVRNLSWDLVGSDWLFRSLQKRTNKKKNFFFAAELARK